MFNIDQNAKHNEIYYILNEYLLDKKKTEYLKQRDTDIHWYGDTLVQVLYTAIQALESIYISEIKQIPIVNKKIFFIN